MAAGLTLQPAQPAGRLRLQEIDCAAVLQLILAVLAAAAHAVAVERLLGGTRHLQVHGGPGRMLGCIPLACRDRPLVALINSEAQPLQGVGRGGAGRRAGG